MPTKKPRKRVLLVAQNAEGGMVEQIDVSLEEYYGGGLPIVDSDEYRKLKGIRILKGQVYGSMRNLMEEFVVNYDSNGKFFHSRAVFEDGTILEG